MANEPPRTPTNWAVVFAGLAIALGVGNGFWSLANPRGDIDKLAVAFVDYRKEVDWKYIRKDVFDFLMKSMEEKNARLEASCVRRDGYEQKTAALDNSVKVLREHVVSLDHSVNLTYSAKDALVGLQNRIAELERATRTASKP